MLVTGMNLSGILFITRGRTLLELLIMGMQWLWLL